MGDSAFCQERKKSHCYCCGDHIFIAFALTACWCSVLTVLWFTVDTRGATLLSVGADSVSRDADGPARRSVHTQLTGQAPPETDLARDRPKIGQEAQRRLLR